MTMSLVLMILIFICEAIMNRFSEGDGEEATLRYETLIAPLPFWCSSSCMSR